MFGRDRYFSCYPTDVQLDVLRSALWQGDAALAAFARWVAAIGHYSELDYGTYRLLPLVYRNLQDQGVTHPLLVELKVLHRQTMADNLKLFARGRHILSALDAEGIDHLVLKGATLVSRYYADLGARAMNDFDVLVPAAQARQAHDLLHQMGWQADLRRPEHLTEDLMAVRHSLSYHNDRGEEFDLHWHVLFEAMSDSADELFWQRTKAVHIDGVATQTLSPEASLFYSVLHGMRPNKMAPIRWMADAYTIVRRSSSLDWNAVVSLAQALSLSLPLHGGLSALHTMLDVSVPVPVLAELAGKACSSEAHAEMRVRETLPGIESDLGYLYAHVHRIEGVGTAGPRILSFLRYLKRYWQLDSYLQMPFYVIGMALRALGRGSSTH